MKVDELIKKRPGLISWRPVQIFLIFAAILISSAAKAQTGNTRFGAFYFDGWGGDTLHLTSALKKLDNREPIWGWKTSTPEIVAQQVALAADAGLDFFNFCWYFNPKTNPKIGGDALNNALGYYLDLSDRKNLHFSIMVTNNGQYTLQATDWTRLVNYWCGLFKDPDYVKVNGSPLLTFFSYPSLLKTFKTTAGIHKALEELRTTAKKSGLQGVTVAISTSQLASLSKSVQAAGFDVVTSYNDHDRMLGKMTAPRGMAKVAASSVVATQQRSVWNSNKSVSALPLIPCLTLNWDDSPWAKGPAGKNFGGYTESSVTNAVTNAKVWMKSNPQTLTKEKIVFIYAWNEYGEGAWLTPSKSGFDPLKALKSAIKKERL
jgi:hypothetical protein